VGLMMRPLLGCADSKADHAAISLGIAMQLTNIARDIGEDRQRQRCYLPAVWGGYALQWKDSVQTAQHSMDAHAAALRLVEMAESFYLAAEQGMGYLPWRSRLTVSWAMLMYRQIGMRIKQMSPARFLNTRAVVPMSQKVSLAFAAVLPIDLINPSTQFSRGHIQKTLADFHKSAYACS
jgi:15-cis-phytoene synthase